jgi:hypothetical protein
MGDRLECLERGYFPAVLVIRNRTATWPQGMTIRTSTSNVSCGVELTPHILMTSDDLTPIEELGRYFVPMLVPGLWSSGQSS